MAELELLLKQAVEAHASDIFIMAGMPLAYKAKGKFIHINEDRLSPLQSECIGAGNLWVGASVYGMGGRKRR